MPSVRHLRRGCFPRKRAVWPLCIAFRTVEFLAPVKFIDVKPQIYLIFIFFSISTALLLEPVPGRSETAEAFGYVSDDELSLEIERRRADIERTQARITNLSALEQKLNSQKQLAEKKAGQTTETVILRTRLFYRLSKSGGSLRYLLGSHSATQFLKRLNLLRHLLHSALENQRQSNLRYTRLSTELEEIRKEKENSLRIMVQLHEVLADLTEEQQRRQQGKTPSG